MLISFFYFSFYEKMNDCQKDSGRKVIIIESSRQTLVIDFCF